MLIATTFERVVELLHRDVVRTVGAAHGAYVHLRAAELREFNLAGADEQLAADVQQEIHDTFVDTSWPACPHHGRHPLWYRDGGWYCDRLAAPEAALGALAEVLGP